MCDLLEKGYSGAVVRDMEAREPMHMHRNRENLKEPRQPVDRTLIEDRGLLEGRTLASSASAYPFEDAIDFYDDESDSDDHPTHLEVDPPSQQHSQQHSPSSPSSPSSHHSQPSQQNWQPMADPQSSSSPEEVMFELGIYVIAGLILILLLERFIQIGGSLVSSMFN
jgi:hypothetical protein